MNELIPVNYNNDTPTASARDLHNFLDKFDNFQDFYVAVNKFKLEYDIDNLKTLRIVINDFAKKYNPSAITYLADNVTQEIVSSREIIKNKKDNSTEHFAYIIGFADKTTKIGVSKVPETRIQTVSKQAGREINESYIYKFDHSYQAFFIESAFKANFKKELLNGEIYNIDFTTALDFMSRLYTKNTERLKIIEAT